ncbi:NADP-dependent oxidoreductase domain-containing protein [Xylaria acuta]|nr:NADP-dependent oxidoreductase domain-containing protein [Xylaria acuta]
MNDERLRQKPPVLLSGAPIPRILYGTARRKQDRHSQVLAALQHGYCGIDTANSRLFHHEVEDGQALANFLLGNPTARGDIFIQSKYAPPSEQAEPWPYAIADDATVRVFKSVLRSAADIGVDVIDAFLLHVPLSSLIGTLEVWHALESIVERGGVRYLGIANVTIHGLQQLFEHADVKPAVVQNWFRKTNGYDREVVAFCREHGIVYQIFGVFDEQNRELLNCNPVKRRSGSTVSPYQALLQILFRVAAFQGLQLCILDGTSSVQHMSENIEAVDQLAEIDEHDLREFLDLIGWG